MSLIVGKRVTVLNGNHQQSSVVFKSYGVQSVSILKLKRGTSLETIKVTPDHEWILADNSRVKTKDLRREELKSLHGDRWFVDEVIPTDEEVEVFCCEEPETHSFILFGGLLTGNCTSTNIEDIRSFGLLMDLAMQGSGTGAVLQDKFISRLPPITTELSVEIVQEIGVVPSELRKQKTYVEAESEDGKDSATALIVVGDSREGWVGAFLAMLELATLKSTVSKINIAIDLGNIRPAGERLSGFGGVANPIKLTEMFGRIAQILNKTVGRQLNSVECCLLLDEAAVTIVAGNIRRSAGMRQFDSCDKLAAAAKDNLWSQDDAGNWSIDPEKDALRMSNHTRVFEVKPTEQECIDSVRKQFYSGEGAIQWAGESIARANADILDTSDKKKKFIAEYVKGEGEQSLVDIAGDEFWDVKTYDKELDHRMQRLGLNPCGEIIGSNLFCNLSEIHLNQLDPYDFNEQEDAFKAGAISVVALLHHKFPEPRYQYSRDIDPIVAVSFTGLFDFCVKAFGVNWLKWWEAGRPANWGEDICYVPFFETFSQSNADLMPLSEYFTIREQEYLNYWKEIVRTTIKEYCQRHSLVQPNRYTALQPAGSKSLLTGASPGWHPPKAQRFIRRITFAKNDPVALACLDYGYSVIPSQSDKDDQGNLLDDPFDPRCTEWLVEIPIAVNWSNVPGADQIDISKFSALAQFDFAMQVQKFYVTHNTSATLEIRENEIELLGNRIYQSIQDDEGYISAALLARFDDLQTFPRLPFEPIDKETYDRLVAGVESRKKTDDFYSALILHDSEDHSVIGPAGCDSDKCLLPEKKP